VYIFLPLAGGGSTSQGNNQEGVDKSLIAIRKMNGASQQKLNQGTNVWLITLYSFLNNRFAITENYQRLKIIQLQPDISFFIFLLKNTYNG
jgi:hypothetical protein